MKRQAFYLIALIVVVYLAIICGSVYSCVVYGLSGGNTEQCSDGRFGEAIASLLAVVLAIYAAKDHD